ncbi:MAG TPA: hypothetical protein VMA37_14770 [Acetobacteraceae bacterium]|nr:hypothetical protein [Acetobacteraceae bacterium]
MVRPVLGTALLALLLAVVTPVAARAEVSANDGYAPDGTYEWHVDLAPYGWVPATSARIKLGNGASASINAGIPSISQLRNVLTGAFLGFGLVRYGPWSAQIDIDYVAASQTKGLGTGQLGIIGRTLDLSTSLVRVAPGFGYEVYKGALGPVPTTLDAQIGFAYFTSSSTLDLSRFGPQGRALAGSSLSTSSDFVQPWLGVRASIYPWPRWRFQLAALVQGLGVSDGSWGWGAGLYASWAATKWLNLVAGFRALDSANNDRSSSAVVRSISVTVYGPLVGLDFTF